MTLTKAKTIFNRITNVARRVVFSDIYSAFLCVFAYVMWLCNFSVAALALFALAMSVTLLLANSPSSLFLPILCCLTSVRSITEQQVVSLWPLWALLLVCVGLFVWRNFPKKFRLGSMFFPMLAVSVALLLGGVGVISWQNYKNSFLLSLGLGLAMLAIYFVLVNFFAPDRDVDVPLHFAKVCTYTATVVCVELLTVILQSGLSPSQWTGSYWDLGWGNRGMLATFLPFGFVMCLYIATRAKRFGFAYMLLAFFQMLCLVLSLSRAGVLFGGIAAIVGVVFCILKGNKKQLLICLGSVVGVVLLLCIIFHNKVGELLSGLADRFSEIKIYWQDGKLIIEGTSGRYGEDGLYGKAVEFFRSAPLFGVGVGGHPNVAISPSDAANERFHSTFYEILASMGIVGLLCYGYYYLMRFWQVFKRSNVKKAFPLFVFITWIAFEGQGLVDMNAFEPVFLIFITLQLAIMEVFTDSKWDEPTQILYLFPNFNTKDFPTVTEEEPTDDKNKS